MKDCIYYLAYGSNLNLEQMKERCPNSNKIGSMILKDYELEFRYYLTVNKKLGCNVPIGIWEIAKEDEKYLDEYEGYPSLYRKEYIPIQVDNRQVEALIYIMNDVRKPERPSTEYFECCVEGYNDFGLDVKYLNKALSLCS